MLLICCNNNKQWNTISDTITDLMNNNLKIHIWVDEGDKFIKQNQRYIDMWSNNHSYKQNVQITFMTATSERILKKYDNLPISNICETDPDLYHYFSDNEFRLYDVYRKPIEYAEYIFDANPDILQSGQFWFIPAAPLKTSHHKMKDMLIGRGFNAVIMINGTDKKIYFEHTCIDIKNEILQNGKKMIEHSLEEWLPIVWKQYELYNKTVAITGELCINRGITIMSENIMITHGIIKNVTMKKRDDAYQLAGRMCGNIKKNKNYKRPIVFCSQKTKNIICGLEKRVKEILQDGEKVASLELLTKREPARDNLIGDTQEFYNETDALICYNAPEGINTLKIRKSKEIWKIAGCKKDDGIGGFFKSTLQHGREILRYDVVKTEMVNWSKASLLDINKVEVGKYRRRVIICYKDMADPSSIVFIIKWARKI